MGLISYDEININHYYSQRLTYPNTFFIEEDNINYLYYTRSGNYIEEHVQINAHRFTYITSQRHPSVLFPPYNSMYVCNTNYMILFVTPRLEVREGREEIWGDHYSMPPPGNFINRVLNSTRFNIVKFHHTTSIPVNNGALLAYFSKNDLKFNYYEWSKKIKLSDIRNIDLVEDNNISQPQRYFRDIFDENQIKLIRDILSFPIMQPLHIMGGKTKKIVKNNKKINKKNKKCKYDFIFVFKIFHLSKWHITVNLFNVNQFVDRFLIICQEQDIKTVLLGKLIDIHFSKKLNVFLL